MWNSQSPGFSKKYFYTNLDFDVMFPEVVDVASHFLSAVSLFMRKI